MPRACAETRTKRALNPKKPLLFLPLPIYARFHLVKNPTKNQQLSNRPNTLNYLIKLRNLKDLTNSDKKLQPPRQRHQVPQ
jgi:hypothetical protein